MVNGIDTLLCCVMCHEPIKINEHEQYVFGNGKDIVRVCNKCKEAINHMRKNMNIKNTDWE